MCKVKGGTPNYEQLRKQHNVPKNARWFSVNGQYFSRDGKPPKNITGGGTTFNNGYSQIAGNSFTTIGGGLGHCHHNHIAPTNLASNFNLNLGASSFNLGLNSNLACGPQSFSPIALGGASAFASAGGGNAFASASAFSGFGGNAFASASASAGGLLLI